MQCTTRRFGTELVSKAKGRKIRCELRDKLYEAMLRDATLKTIAENVAKNIGRISTLQGMINGAIQRCNNTKLVLRFEN